MIQTGESGFGVLVTPDGVELLPDPDCDTRWRLLPVGYHLSHGMRYIEKNHVIHRLGDFDSLPIVETPNLFPPVPSDESDISLPVWIVDGAHVHIPDTLILRIANFTVFCRTSPGNRCRLCWCVTTDDSIIQFNRDPGRGSIYWSLVHAHMSEEKMSTALIDGQTVSFEMAEKMARHALVNSDDMELYRSVMIK
jgi:hypothetical protein